MAAAAGEVLKPGGQNFRPGATNVSCTFMSGGCRQEQAVAEPLTELRLCHSNQVTAAEAHLQLPVTFRMGFDLPHVASEACGFLASVEVKCHYMSYYTSFPLHTPEC